MRYTVDHIGIAVHELAPALRTYRDILGLACLGEETLEERGLTVGFMDGGNTRLELIAPTRPDSEVSRFLAKRGEGVHHICLRVDDIQAAVRDLQGRGAVLTAGGIKPGAHGAQVAFLHPSHTHGVLIELTQPADSTA